MKSVILTAAAALLAGTALAAAQSGGNMGNHSQGAAPAPAAQQQAPADKMAPAAQNKAQTPAQTTGQAPKAGADVKAQTNSEAPKANADVKAPDSTTNAAQKNDDKETASGKAGDKAKSTADTKTRPTDNKAAADQKNGKSSAQTDTKSKSGATTGQGAAGAKGAANLSTEQRTKIRTVIKEKVHARPLTNVNFSISVGTAVPRSVHFYPVPTEVIEVYPAWRGYNFILVNDQIVIIDPSSFMIVAIIA